MARTTTQPTIEELAEQAAAIEAQAAQLRAEQARLVQAEQDRLAEHRAQVDAEILKAGSRRAEHDAAVEAAQAELRAAIANDPVTQALVRLYEAVARRRFDFDRYINALESSGQSTAGAQHPQGEPGFDVAQYQRQLAEQAGHATREKAETEHHARRDNPEGK